MQMHGLSKTSLKNFCAAKLVPVFVSAAFLAANATPSASAETSQPLSLNGTQVQKFHSNKAGADFLLYLSFPRDYDKTKESYPVVFVLDADYCFPLAHDIARFLADHDEARPVIMVGIAYPGVAEEKYGPILKRSRTRDYTPWHVSKGGYGAEYQKQSGGADKFLDCIESELIPDLEKNFRIKKDRTIVGYSFGGLFASYAMITRPSLFQRFLIVSPSLWYDKKRIFSVLQKSLPDKTANRISSRITQTKPRAFFCVGGHETSAQGAQEMVGELKSFTSQVRGRKSQTLETRIWIAPDETHHSVFPAAFMRGFRWLFL